ncbi:DUF4190 domain-containing protein [Streptococcus oralis]|nr:DUF4190 domain-containing protein [Streptococcus oralis]MBZ2094547.1 DUF4190 domain-containing protein [Streptococcus oralis]MBZ2097607.1 DUF4190 domain-containing protein [Streptococcus oralis]QXW62323.1 DUF4190 domain-containing protein [Streptococcus oralis]
MNNHFKGFLENARKEKNPLLVGILSIILSLLFPLGGIGLGITGVLFANELQKESGLDYKTERIIAIVGIVLSALNWITGVILHMS